MAGINYLPRVGFEPPEQSQASYEASALPQATTTGFSYEFKKTNLLWGFLNKDKLFGAFFK